MQRIRRSIKERSKSAKTDLNQVELDKKCNVLSRRLMNWLALRKVYYPPMVDDGTIAPNTTSSEEIPTVDDSNDAVAPNIANPENADLRLPSSLPVAVRDLCPFRLADIEHRLRQAQAEDSLADLRRQLRVSMGLTHYKVTQVGSSQRSSTRALSLIARFQEKIWRNVERYRVARAALEALDPGGVWKDQLRVLKDGDVRGLGKGDGESESRREISWIWRVEGVGGMAQDTDSSLSDRDLDDCESHHSLGHPTNCVSSQVFAVSGSKAGPVQIGGTRRLIWSSRRCAGSCAS
jgi:hypothetical protein